jgi:hypothetical protein
MRRAEVFTPNTLPSVTFIGDHLMEHKKLLLQNLEQGGAVIAISGPSKSGKTVFVETTLGQDNLIQVTGANIGTPEDLWRRIFTVIGTPIPSTKTTGNSSERSLLGTVEGGVPLVAKMQGAVAEKSGDSTNQTVDVKPDYLSLLVKELKGTGLVVFVDDFHYIASDIQTEIATVIKEAVREGLRFVLAAVPYHADDVVIANSDLRGRMLKLDFDYWNKGELAKIAERGFEALNATVTPATIAAFATEAAGSPQLMQSLCLNLCFEVDLEETSTDRRTLQPNAELINKVCRRTAQTNDYSSVIRMMKDGPKVRGTERNSYVLKAGTASDVYPILVSAIAQNPPELTMSYPNLLARIASMCVRDHPQGSSVTGACAHISALANETAGTSIIEWDGAKDVLDIRDPYLLFALRWSEST